MHLYISIVLFAKQSCFAKPLDVDMEEFETTWDAGHTRVFYLDYLDHLPGDSSDNSVLSHLPTPSCHYFGSRLVGSRRRMISLLNTLFMTSLLLLYGYIKLNDAKITRALLPEVLALSSSPLVRQPQSLEHIPSQLLDILPRKPEDITSSLAVRVSSVHIT
jgi:hypothetical protein